MRILSLDVGDKRIGLAVSDPMGIVASPLSVYTRIGPVKDIDNLLRIAREQEAERLLVGIPVSLDGVERGQAEKVRHFCEALRQKSAIPVMTYDERLSTVQAGRQMREMGVSAEKRKAMRDAAAAAVFLQSYLDGVAASRMDLPPISL